jgi:outer membrane protein TolC
MKRKIFRLYAAIAFGCTGYFSATAQAPVHSLALEEAINNAKSNNRQLNISKLEEKVSQYNYRSTAAYFLPQVNLSYSAFTTNNPLHAFGFKLQQQVITQDDFNPKLLNNPSSTSDFMTQVNVQQPLFNMDMAYMRKAVYKQTEVLSYKTNRLKEYLEFQVKEAYLQLQLIYETKKVLEASLVTYKALYQFTKDRYDQGLLQKSDLLNTEVLVRTMETNLTEVLSGIQNTSDRLNLLMGKAPGVVYTVSGAMKDPLLTKDTLTAGRSDFQAMEAAIASMDYSIKSNRAGLLPRINAFANYQLHDQSPLGFGGDGHLAGVQLSWDLFKGNSVKNKTASLELEKNKMNEELLKQKEESRSDMRKALRQYQDAGNTISKQKLAVSAAEEAFRVLQNRYNQGLVNTTDVLMAQTQVSNQQLALAQAVFAQQMATAWLEFLTRNN